MSLQENDMQKERISLSRRKKILICAQAVDTQDLALGFFVRWIEEFAKHYEHVSVICLKQGSFTLPKNVSVYSLGKEQSSRPRLFQRIRYGLRLYKYAWSLRREYDMVFVHMNQEYILAVGWLWALLGKKIYMWRNHYAGNSLTDIAAAFCTKIFCTSRHSYTARYKRSVLMPVGIDVETYHVIPGVARIPNSILWYARIAPSKRLKLFIEKLFIETLGLLRSRGVSFSASVYGTPLPEDVEYYENIKSRAAALGISDSVRFFSGVLHSEGPNIFSAHELFVNTSPGGMYDKTIFEAAMCRCIVLASNQDFAGIAMSHLVFEEDNPVDLAGKIAKLLTLRSVEREEITDSLKKIAERNNLTALGNALIKEMQNASSV